MSQHTASRSERIAPTGSPVRHGQSRSIGCSRCASGREAPPTRKELPDQITIRSIPSTVIVSAPDRGASSSRRRVPRDLLGVLERPPVRQVRRDPERMLDDVGGAAHPGRGPAPTGRLVVHLPRATPDLDAWRQVALALGARAGWHPVAASPSASGNPRKRPFSEAVRVWRLARPATTPHRSTTLPPATRGDRKPPLLNDKGSASDRLDDDAKNFLE